MYKIGITGTLNGITDFQDAAVALYIREEKKVVIFWPDGDIEIFEP